MCRDWDEDSDDGSVRSLPESTLQQKKLQERSLLAEIKLLRQSMLEMKSMMHMEAAGRAGVETRIPYPREDYGINDFAMLLHRPKSALQQAKNSNGWEELALSSHSPSAMSVKGRHSIEQEVCL